MNILFIGNSYTYYNDMPLIFSSLLRENGREAAVDSVTKGGAALSEHLEEGCEMNLKIRAKLDEKKYDVLFLQDLSYGPISKHDGFILGVTELKKLVDAKKTILYSTWGRKYPSPKLLELRLTSDEMTSILYERYSDLGKELGTPISPVGLVFKDIFDRGGEDTYDPDLSHPSYYGSAVAALTHYRTLFGENARVCDSLNLSEKALSDALSAIDRIFG